MPSIKKWNSKQDIAFTEAIKNSWITKRQKLFCQLSKRNVWILFHPFSPKSEQKQKLHPHHHHPTNSAKNKLPKKNLTLKNKNHYTNTHSWWHSENPGSTHHLRKKVVEIPWVTRFLHHPNGGRLLRQRGGSSRLGGRQQGVHAIIGCRCRRCQPRPLRRGLVDPAKLAGVDWWNRMLDVRSLLNITSILV